MSEKDKRLTGLNPASIPPQLRKSPVRYNRSSVLKMLAVMEQTHEQKIDEAEKNQMEGAAGENEFLNTGRTGRRNALPDILSEHANVNSADLPRKLEALTTKDKECEPSTSKE